MSRYETLENARKLVSGRFDPLDDPDGAREVLRLIEEIEQEQRVAR
ncbi:MAG TPA: hypothetical protein VGL78_10960 [Solirubrobacteraceae bacterium]|jgi:hypothetical protein